MVTSLSRIAAAISLCLLALPALAEYGQGTDLTKVAKYGAQRLQVNSGAEGCLWLEGIANGKVSAANFRSTADSTPLRRKSQAPTTKLF
jgi:hypothetical protein